MPGYVIHIAVAQEYLKKKNKPYSNDFILGTIAPDLTTPKSKTHYGRSPAYTNLYDFIMNNELDSDYSKGFFLHLIADYLFYNKYLNKIEKPQIYNDYDFTNLKIMEKYNVILPQIVKDKVFFKEGEPTLLTIDLAYKVIDEISSLDLDIVKKEVMENNVKWRTFKNLV